MPEEITYQYQMDGEAITTRDAIQTGRQIRANAGLNPASDYVLIEIGDNMSRSIGLEEEIELREGVATKLLSFKSDRVFSLTINERGYEWGSDEISAAEIRQYASIAEGHELVLDSAQEKIIADDEIVRLKPKGVERILSRPPAEIRIIVNTRPKPWTKKKISFAEVIALAYPTPPTGENIVFTVGFFDGPPGRPEGSLTDGESVRVRDGMVFDVKFTDKS